MNFKLLLCSLLIISSHTLLAKENLEIHGHRGARWLLPENTIPAFEHALKVGADTLEMDLVVTKDKVLVVTHDPILNTAICTDKNGKPVADGIKIYTLTLKELKKYSCGSVVNPRFKEQASIKNVRIPTLDEVFTMVKKSKVKNVKFNIETKIEEAYPDLTPTPEEFTKLVIEKIKKYNLIDQVTLQSFDFRTLKIAKELEPKLKLSALLEYKPANLQELENIIKEYKIDYFSPNHEWLSQDQVDLMHKNNVKVVPWTVNLPADWQKAIALKVDGIITDNPKGLIEWLKQNK